MKILLYLYRKYQKTSGPFRTFLIYVYNTWSRIRTSYRCLALKIEGKPLKIRNNVTDSAIVQCIFGANELLIFAPIIKEFAPKYIVDAGAYAGYSSVWYARKYPDATVIAIEPEGSNYEILSENIRPYGNILGMKKALWPVQTSVHVRDMGTGDWGFKMEIEETNTTESVNTITVEQLLDQSPENKIDILKIDIEGAEIDLLANTKEWEDKVSVIMIELHEWFAPGSIAAYDKFKSQGNWVEFINGNQRFLIKPELCAV